jgi:RNA polymerase sigma-70 factor (ECF subfamily)
LEKALGDLTSKLKSVFILHDVQGFKHHEIAQIMGCSVGTSKSQLFKARKKIRKFLQKEKILGEYS